MRATLLILFIFGSASVGRSADPTELLRQGIDSYQLALETTDRGLRTERFEIAQAYFDKAVDQQGDRVTASLWINLGNAAIGAENLSAAVLAYRRALELEPDNAKAQRNLRHARSLLPSWVPVPRDDSNSIGAMFDWRQLVRVGDWGGITAIAFLAFAITALLYQQTNRRVVAWFSGIALVAWLILIAATLLVPPTPQRDAVIAVSDVIARSADSPGAPPLLKEPLPAGVEVTVLENRDEWVRAALADGRDVWLRRSEIAMVDPNSDQLVSTSDRVKMPS
ncbi:tetratricopeptide repeat protein [Rhodopirellula sp. MGV]|uniref:tetratricopeptide repeat protein n=1 Tax=Rhodopirellula sp. MGV TaxID=2023130 RepID=UPI00117AE63D|nr:tetratricopeptide repeat protein [Rhodopirellula sp. MGV]